MPLGRRPNAARRHLFGSKTNTRAEREREQWCDATCAKLMAPRGSCRPTCSWPLAFIFHQRSTRRVLNWHHSVKYAQRKFWSRLSRSDAHIMAPSVCIERKYFRLLLMTFGKVALRSSCEEWPSKVALAQCRRQSRSYFCEIIYALI